MARKNRPDESRPRRARTQNAGASTPPNSDYLLGAAEEFWPYILDAYKKFEEKKPVMLLDIQEQRIYAYPYADFSSELNEKSQGTLKDQYERAVQDNKVVVFVRDNERRRLVSFSMDNE